MFRVRQNRLSGKKNIFILSTGRTATTYLADYLNGRPGVRAVHEPKPSRILRMWTMASFEGKVSPPFLRAALYGKRKRLYKNVGEPVYIESNPYLVGFSGVIGDVFDKPTVIHIVRDPRDFVKSAMNHGNDRGLKLFFNRYVPYWYPDIRKVLDLDKKIPMRYQAAGYWKIVNDALLEYGRNNPDNYHLLKYEDIFKGDKKGMDELARIIGVDAGANEKTSEKSRNKSRFSSVAAWQDWSDEDCRAVNDLCQPTMAKLGYGDEEEWKRKVGGNNLEGGRL